MQVICVIVKCKHGPSPSRHLGKDVLINRGWGDSAGVSPCRIICLKEMGEETKKPAVLDQPVVENRSYILERLIIVLGALVTAFWLAGIQVVALWFTAATAILVSIDVALRFQLRTSQLAQVGVAVTFIAVFGLAVHLTVIIRHNEMRSAETETHGWLVPAHDPMPDNPCLHSLHNPPSNALVIVMGSTAAWTTADDYAALVFGHCTSLRLQRSANGLAVSGALFDQDNKLVVIIKKNEFHLVSTEFSYTERSEDLSTLTVHDPTDKVILRVRYTNPNAVEITGDFYCDGQELVIAPETIWSSVGLPPLSDSCFGNDRGGGLFIG